MPIEKEGRKGSIHRRTRKGNRVYISSTRNTTEITNQHLSGEGKLLTNDGEKFKKGTYLPFLLSRGSIWCQ